MRLARQGLRVTCCKSDIASVAGIAAVIALWASVAAGAASFGVLMACEAAFFTFYLAGSLLAAFEPLAAGIRFDLPLRLLTGYGIVNTGLLALAWLSPWGMVTNGCALAALVLFSFFFAAGKRELVRGEAVTLGVVGLCLLATTLWCQDSIRPVVDQGAQVIYRPWVDGFYHSVHIRIFAESHGASSIQDFRMSGVPARPYHYGMYMLPALVKQASGLHGYAAFAGILAPVGVFFTGLAAYAFFASAWGAWPGFAATAALLLLPDGAQQGVHNPFMSYHFLTQISPSATHGLALLVVAWLFVMQGSARGSRLQLFAGWFIAGVSVFYKLHYVVASALLLLLVPASFFRAQLSIRKRAAWVAAAFVIYVFALTLLQKVPGVPLIRFDASSVGEIMRLILSFAEPSALRELVVAHTGPKLGAGSNLLFGLPYVVASILGLFAPLLALLVVRLRRRTPLLYLLFPLLLSVNFLVMFFGLALDFSSSTPDELSHRPLMIVYFFVVSFVGGALGQTLFESARLRSLARPVMVCLAMALLAIPALFGPGVQRLWAMPKISPVRLPRELLQVAEYIRSHGGPDDVFQDSQFDRIYALAALSERRAFVAHTMTRVDFRADMVEARTNAVDHFMGIRQAKLLVATARALGFRWFVLQRGDRVDWPAEVADHPAAQMGPFKVYAF